MPERTLAAKMKVKPGYRLAVINSPDGYLEELGELPTGAELRQELRGKFDWIHVFVRNKAELEKAVPGILRALKPESLLWISYPKGSSKIQTDLTRDRGWDSLKDADLKWINLISVDDTWSAFSLRPYKEGEERQSFR